MTGSLLLGTLRRSVTVTVTDATAVVVAAAAVVVTEGCRMQEKRTADGMRSGNEHQDAAAAADDDAEAAVGDTDTDCDSGCAGPSRRAAGTLGTATTVSVKLLQHLHGLLLLPLLLLLLQEEEAGTAIVAVTLDQMHH